MIMPSSSASASAAHDPSYANANLGPSVLHVAWSLAAISIVIVGIRLATRAFVVRVIKLDDYVMVLSLVSIERLLAASSDLFE
jgi:hypothetical protein